MKEEILTLGSMIEDYECQCIRECGSLTIAEQLFNRHYPNKSKPSFAYFECLKAAIKSDGSLDVADDELKKCLRRYSLNKSRRTLREEGYQAD